ncbi:MAG: double-strand break repair protein AddB [Paracoccaceae bacterium]|jgi:ATP-dependent helicase/nuclease subunit B
MMDGPEDQPMPDMFPGLFADSPGPRVYYLPPGVDFAAEMARGLAERLRAAPPAAMARIRVVANARRTARAIETALEARSDALWLPRFGLIADAGEDMTAASLPPAADPLRRRLALLRLVEALLERAPDFGPLSAAPALSQSLAALLDDLQGAGKGADDLRGLDVEDHAEHWRRTQIFLSILTEAWPQWLARDGDGAGGAALDPQARRLMAAMGMEALWASAPPATPVIAAGSTGSTPATAAALAAIARAPLGAVVLPGLDPEIADDVRERLAMDNRRASPEHPQAGLHALIDRIGARWQDIRPWTDAAPPAPARLRLLSEALRPAPVTDRWRAAAPALRARVGAATDDLTLLEAASDREEAAAIALLLAEAARGTGTAALITPDRTLARRVTAELGRWNLLPDDSAGTPLSLTPPGVLLGLLADAMGRPMTAARLSALMRHPLVGGDGVRRRNHLRALRLVERAALRGGAPEVNWDRLAPAIIAAQTRRDRPEAAAETSAALLWLAALRAALGPLSAPPLGLGATAALHLRAAEAISAALPGTDAGGALDSAPPLGNVPEATAPPNPTPPNPTLPIWRKGAGEDARAFMDALIAAAPAHDDAAHAPDRPQSAYAALFAGLAAERDARAEAARPHDRIAILGPLEARAMRADLTILGGLNEGLWPGLPDPDPWMTRDMRKTLGLAPPEARIGLSAHDFLLAANAPRAVLSRSRKSGGSPTVASRWLIRLANLLTGVDEASITAMRARGDAVIARASALDALPPTAPAPRPDPRPPVTARPRELPVTAVETLIRDPYAVYARYVLRLRALEPIGRAPDARDMGNALHAAMEAFAHAADGIGPNIPALRAALLDATRATLDAKVPSAALRRLWMKRIERAADWFATTEAARRAHAPRILPEARGQRRLNAPGGPFTLTARADRIDLRADGTIAIYDYKTGAPPTKPQQKAFAKQLTLSADIARAGGFANVPGAQVAEIAYLGLTGSGTGGKTEPVDGDPGSLDEAWHDLITLISAYDAADQPYPARTRPKHLKYSGDYDHLSRFGEWGDTGEEDDA